MEKYILQESKEIKYWICTDQRNGLVCRFKEHDFNRSQKFTLLEDSSATPLVLARICAELADWLKENHPNLLSIGNDNTEI